MREVFVGLALVMVVGIALLMQLVGLSAALGTFLAGVVLAESEYRHELEMDLEPFKGLLLAVFFIAVGAGIDFSLLFGQPLFILGLVAGFIAVKLVVLFVLARLFGMGTPDASRFSFALAQGGEFAFVLISFAAGLALLEPAQAGTAADDLRRARAAAALRQR
jgi:Kef-type K+ transport system membrane component KefB